MQGSGGRHNVSGFWRGTVTKAKVTARGQAGSLWGINVYCQVCCVFPPKCPVAREPIGQDGITRDPALCDVGFSVTSTGSAHRRKQSPGGSANTRPSFKLMPIQGLSSERDPATSGVYQADACQRPSTCDTLPEKNRYDAEGRAQNRVAPAYLTAA